MHRITIRKSVFLFFLLISISLVHAQNANRIGTKRILYRTNKVIKSAHAAIKKNQHFKGDFKKAYNHQSLAITYFRKARYNKAIHHSLKARKDAAKVIRDNRGETVTEIKLNSEENSYLASSPDSDSLTNELNDSSVKEIEEEELVKTNINLSVE